MKLYLVAKRANEFLRFSHFLYYTSFSLYHRHSQISHTTRAVEQSVSEYGATVISSSSLNGNEAALDAQIFLYGRIKRTFVRLFLYYTESDRESQVFERKKFGEKMNKFCRTKKKGELAPTDLR